MLKTFLKKKVVMVTSVLLLLLLLIMSCSCGSATQMPQYARTPGQMAEINNGVVALIAPVFSIAQAEGEEGDAPAEDALTAEEQEEAQSISYRIYCTGAFIAENLVLTAQHCIDDAEEEGQRVRIGTYDDYIDTQATFRNRRWRYFDIVASDAANDLALLRLAEGEPNLRSYEILELALADPRNGEFVFCMGHPRGLGWTLTYGVVSQATRVGAAATPGNDTRTIFVQSSAQAFFGNSGGPLMNSDNQIIGVVSRGGPWHIVMSVHISMIREFICASDENSLHLCTYFLSAGAESTPEAPLQMTVQGHQR